MSWVRLGKGEKDEEIEANGVGTSRLIYHCEVRTPDTAMESRVLQ